MAKLKDGTKTKFGVVEEPDCCSLCKYEGSCEEDVYEFCQKNLAKNCYFR
jgi:hypothetical protein